MIKAHKILTLIIALAFCFTSLSAQGIVKGSGVLYTNGAPTHTVNLNADSELAIDTTTGFWYERSRDGLGWLLAGFRIQETGTTGVPTGAPADKESYMVINNGDSLYHYRAAAWRHINSGTTYTGGTGINITGTVISNTGDLSATNEGILGVSAGSGTTSVITSTTSGATGVTVTAGTGLSIAESTSSNGGTITLTNSSPDQTVSITNGGGVAVSGSYPNFTLTATDQSITNEVLTISDGTNSEALGGQTLIVSGGGINVAAYNTGTNTLTITGTEIDGTVSNEGSLTVGAGTGTTSIINSNTSGSTGVTVSASTGISISESGNTITLTNSAPDQTVSITNGGGVVVSGTYPAFTLTATDQSVTNENLTITDGTNTESLAGQTLTVAGAGINTAVYNTGTNTLTITGTEVDGSTTNEIQTYGHSGTSTYTNTLSTGGGSWSLTGGGIAVVSQTGGAVTVTATEVDGSTTNEVLTITDGTNSEALGGQTLTVAGAGINVATYTPGSNTLTITGTEVDGSLTNEGSLTVVAGGGNDSQIHSNTSGSTDVVIAGGTNVTVTESGSTITISATPGAGVTDLTFSGTSSPVTLNSSTGTDVTFTAGGINAFSATSGNITITATEVDGSVTNELQTYGHSGTTSYTNTLSNSGGSFTLQPSGIVTVSNSSGTVTIGATEVDGSITNELQTIANTSDATSHTATLSNSGGSIQFVEGSGITMATTGTSGAGILTVTAVDASTTNELQTYSHAGTTTYTNTLSNSGGSWSITGAGIAAISQTGGAITVTATEVDGSVANEGLLGVGAGSGTSSVLLSNTSGATGVTINAAGINAITESTSANGGSITITATEVDGSVANEGSLSVVAGGANDSEIQSNTSGSTNLVIAGGTNVTVTESGSTITISATPGIGGITTLNTLTASTQTFATGTSGTDFGISSATATHTFNLPTASASNRGALSSADWSAFNSKDGSVTNEGSLTVAAGSGTTSVIQSNTSGSTDVTLTASTGLSISETGNVITLTNSSPDQTVSLTNGGGVVVSGTYPNFTLTATDQSITNEVLTISDGTNSEALGGQTLTVAGAGINTAAYNTATNTLTITGTEIDGSISNEGSLTVGAGTGTTSIINSNTSGSTGVTLTASTGLSISEAGNVVTLTNSSPDQTVSLTNGGGIAVSGTYPSFTLTATDQSTTNELQTIANTSSSTTHTATLSNSGGSIQFVEGANITLTTSGTGLDGIVTIAATSGSGTDLSVTGTSSPVTLNSSTGTDVTFTAGGINAISATSGNITITATEVDGSTTNELQTYSHGGTTTYTNTLSNSGGSWSLTGAGIAVISQTAGAVTVTATEVDGSITNEGSLTVGAGTGTTSIINSNTSGSTGVTLTASTGLSISESGNVITLTNSSPDQTVSISNGGGIAVSGTYPSFTLTATDQSITNEVLTISDGTNSEALGGQTLTVAGAGINVAAYNTGTNTLTITGTEVDGSVTNELQTYSHSGTTTYTNTLSNSGGSWSITGAGIAAISQTAGAITVTATEVDGSTTNELQTVANTSDATSHTVTLSNSGGSIQLVEGSGVTLTTSGTSGAGVVTIAAAGGGINYQTFRDDGSNMTQQPNANFVSTGTVAFTLANDAGNTETEVSAAVPAGGITSTELAASSVNSSKIRDTTIVAGDIKNATITSAKLANSGVSAGSYPSTNTLVAIMTINAQGQVTAVSQVAAADGSSTNEGVLGVAGNGSNDAALTTNTSIGNSVIFSGGPGIGVSETTNTNGGTITFTNTGDTSSTNDLTLSDTVRTVSGASTHSKYPTALAVYNAITGATAGSGDILNGGNTTGATVVIGTNDANALELETNGTSRVAIGTTGAVTSNVELSNTNTVGTALTIQANSTGTPAAGFGSKIQFNGESSTTNNRDMGSIETVWTTATDGSRVSALVLRTGNAFGGSESARFSGNSLVMGGGTLSLSSAGLLGSNSVVNLQSTAASGSVNVVGGSETNTSLAKKIQTLTGTYTAASGSGTMTSIAVNPTYNLTSTASGAQIGIDIDPTLTSLSAATFRGINMPYNNASAFGMYQSGALTKNYFAGSVGIGTTSAAEALHVVGNSRTDGTVISRGTGTTATFRAQNTTGGTGKSWEVSSWDDGTLAIGHSGIGAAITVDGSTEKATFDGNVQFDALSSATSTGLMGATSGNIATRVKLGAGLVFSNDTLSATSGGGGATDLAFSGSSSPVTLTSSTGTDVTFVAGANVTLSQAGNALTINSTSSGGTNYQTLRDDGSDMTQRANANFVSTGTVAMALTDDAGNGETEIRATIPSGAVGDTELASTGVTAATYTNATVIVNVDGRVTSASSGTPTVVTATSLTADADNLSASAGINVLRVSGDNGVRAITSISATGMPDGQSFSIINTGTQPIVLQAQHPDATSGNEFLGPKDVFLPGGQSITATRDATSDGFWLDGTAGKSGRIISSTAVAGSSTAADWGGITLSTNGGTIANGAANANGAYYWNLGTSTSASAGPSISVGKGSAPTRFGDCYLYSRAILRLTNLSNGTNEFYARSGLNSTTGPGAFNINSAIILYTDGLNGGRWLGRTTGATVSTDVDLGVTVAANTDYLLEVYVNKQGTEARFFIDGIYRGRSTTTMPVAGTTAWPQAAITKTAGTTARSLYVSEISATYLYSN